LNAFSDELRLLWTLLLNAGVFITAYAFARRRGSGGVLQAICDAFLLYFLVQYVAVGVTGVLGVFNAGTMTLAAAAAAMGMWVCSRSGVLTKGNAREAGTTAATFVTDKNGPSSQPSPPSTEEKGPEIGRARGRLGVGSSTEEVKSLTRSATGFQALWHGRLARGSSGRHGRAAHATSEAKSLSSLESPLTGDHLALIACALFVAGFLRCYAWSQRYIPPMSTDALVYHLPTAVQWIQTHRLGIYPTWYWNPAASYSPGTGAIFMAWWMAPAGNDLFVRFVQLPALIFIFFLVARMCRLMGCSRTIAGLIGIGVALSRPLFSEAIFAKDDLYVTAFVTAAVLSLAREPIRDRLGPWRVGVSLGMVLASKYTVLLACPVFLFLIDSPFRARWPVRNWMVAIGSVLVLALPWYLRNILLTRNPLYPVDVHLPGLVLKGLFTTERDRQLQSANGVWHMLSDTYHSLPTAMIVLLMAGWLAACIAGFRSIVRDALPRACAVGSVVALILFLKLSPHHEVRYLFPLIVLLFATMGIALAAIGKLRALSGAEVAIVLAIGVATVSVATSFSAELKSSIASLAGEGLLVAAIGVGLTVLQTRVLRLTADRLALLGACVLLLFGVAIYVEWRAYVNAYRDARQVAWNFPSGYPRQAGIWKWVDDNVPADGTVAYANTFFVYPYYGFDLSRHVEYAPVRKGLHDFSHFPRLGERVPGDLIVRRMTEVMNADADRDTWLQNLRAMKAEYLVVIKRDPDNLDLSADPPELKFARREPGIFVVVDEDEAGVVFRVSGNLKSDGIP
jgi:hypothetical protein